MEENKKGNTGAAQISLKTTVEKSETVKITAEKLEVKIVTESKEEVKIIDDVVTKTVVKEEEAGVENREMASQPRATTFIFPENKNLLLKNNGRHLRICT